MFFFLISSKRKKMKQILLFCHCPGDFSEGDKISADRNHGYGVDEAAPSLLLPEMLSVCCRRLLLNSEKISELQRTINVIC